LLDALWEVGVDWYGTPVELTAVLGRKKRQYPSRFERGMGELNQLIDTTELLNWGNVIVNCTTAQT
jgi:hypothetical protein